MKKSIKKKRHNLNHLHQIPGEVVYVGNRELPFSIEIYDYDTSKVEHLTSSHLKDVFSYRDTKTVSWIDVTGLSHVEEISALGMHFGLHPLLIEDIVNTGQRPKFEEFEGGLFMVFKMLKYRDAELMKMHFAIVLGKNYVLTFHDDSTQSFENLRKRIEFSRGHIRQQRPDYLMYAIIDVLVDDYFIIADRLSDKAVAMEDKLFAKDPGETITEEIQYLKREIMSVRKAVQPLRESIKQLENTQHPLIHRKTRNYLKDLSDHTVQVAENIEIYREVIWSLMEMYMATVSNRMNEVMKVLTIMASIFIPLTFIAGVYGMNFEYMPELGFHEAYFIALGFMLLIGLVMLWYFKRKKWL